MNNVRELTQLTRELFVNANKTHYDRVMTRELEIYNLLNRGDVRRYVASILGHSDRADDVLQSVAEKLLNKATQVGEPRRLVFPMVRNAAIDSMRKSSRRENYEHQFAEHTANSASYNVEDQAELERFAAKIGAIVRELPLLTQSLFIGYHVLGLSQQELAQQHNLHLSTVEKRLAKAKKYCRQRLSESC